MALKAERTEHADRTHYLGERTKVGVYGTRVNVITWPDASGVTLALRQGAFDYQDQLQAQEARAIAQALLLAAEDAERAAAAIQTEVVA